jgi:hypothetical protein
VFKRTNVKKEFAVLKKLDDVKQVRTLGTSQANSAPS